MKYVPVKASGALSRLLLKADKNSPQVLFGAGIVGVVATTVLACRATLKVESVLEKTQEGLQTINQVVSEDRADYTEKDAHKDKAYVYIRAGVDLGRLYWPSVVVGTLSIVCLTKSHNTLTRRNAGLMAAYAAVERSFASYRERVIADIGEERERELYYPREIVEYEDEKTGKTKKVKTVTPGSRSMYAKFFDERSSSWNRTPEYNVVFLRAQQNYANDLLRSRGHVLLNDVYDMLGIERTKAGAVVGWLRDGKDGYVDFGIFDKEMTPQAWDFFTGHEGAILLDFNVDGVIYDQI